MHSESVPQCNLASNCLKAAFARRRSQMFMDKPIAASLAEVLAIYTFADALEVPVFSSSSLRWLPGIQEAQKTAVMVGANVTSPCPFETQFRPRPDLYHCKQSADLRIASDTSGQCVSVRVVRRWSTRCGDVIHLPRLRLQNRTTNGDGRRGCLCWHMA